MEYDPRKTKSHNFRNAQGNWRKIIVQRELLLSEYNTIKLLIRSSDQEQEAAHFESLQLVWLDRRFEVGTRFYIWGLTMDELAGLARNFAPRSATAYEVHGQFQGFMFTQELRPAADRVSLELAKAGGA